RRAARADEVAERLTAVTLADPHRHLARTRRVVERSVAVRTHHLVGEDVLLFRLGDDLANDLEGRSRAALEDAHERFGGLEEICGYRVGHERGRECQRPA